MIFDVVKHTIETHLPETTVLDVAVSPSTAMVNYSYDKLYEVTINYSRDKKIKQMVTFFGITDGTWIVPKKTDLIIKDAEAKAIHATRPTSNK